MNKIKLLGHAVLFLSLLYIGIGWMYRAPERMEQGYIILFVAIVLYAIPIIVSRIKRK
jgi:hypothetical protein